MAGCCHDARGLPPGERRFPVHRRLFLLMAPNPGLSQRTTSLASPYAEPTGQVDNTEMDCPDGRMLARCNPLSNTRQTVRRAYRTEGQRPNGILIETDTCQIDRLSDRCRTHARHIPKRCRMQLVLRASPTKQHDMYIMRPKPGFSTVVFHVSSGVLIITSSHNHSRMTRDDRRCASLAVFAGLINMHLIL
jgi:hypothetical protein